MNTTNNQNEKFTERLKNSVSFKLSIIVILSLIMLIPTIFIRNLITERQLRRDDTLREVTSKWGEEQQIFGPLLVVPYLKREVTSNNKYVSYKYYMHIMPDDLKINGELVPDVRRRGIYEVTIYSGKLEVSGNFLPESLNDMPNQPEQMLWDKARLIIGISDLNGLDAIHSYTWNKSAIATEGGIPNTSSVQSGVNSKVEVNPDDTNSFHLDFTLNGSDAIRFVPAGKSTEVNISSSWPDPSFSGAALPEHDISPEGFTARWQSMDLKRPFPQKWSGESYVSDINRSAFGVDLIIPVDVYQKSERSVKYALLFIGMTFLVIFFIEMISKQKIHPVQYLLTGAALIVFYSLLLALSEHLPFSIAYIISSVGIIGLIVGYASSIFRKRRYVITTTIVLVALYGFLFTILQLSDLALLVGNIGLFMAIALVMFSSRKIDWYNNRNTENA